MQMIKKKDLLKNILLLSAISLLCLFFAEVLLRLTTVSPINEIIPMYVSDDSLGQHRFRPDFGFYLSSEDGFRTYIHTNSLGIWEEEDPPYKQDTILIVGDSFTFGPFCCNLSETYPKVVESRLKENNFDFKVLNAGVPAYNVKNSLELFKSLSSIIKPKIGILTLYIGNDISDQSNPYQLYVVDGVLRGDHPKEGGFSRVLSRHSALARVASRLVTDYLLKDRSYFHNHLSLFKKDAKEKYLKDEIDLAEKDLLEFNMFCKNNHITCLVNIIPERFQSKSVMERALSFYPSDEFDFYWLQEHFKTFFEENNIAYLDSSPYLEDDDNYLKYNGHWTKKGSYIVGYLVADFLIDEHMAGFPKVLKGVGYP